MTLCDTCKVNEAEKDNTLCLVCTNMDNYDGSNNSDYNGKQIPEAQVVNITYIRSELLCYAIRYVESSSPDKLIEVICSSFSVYEIKEARDLLWKVFASHLETNPRRSGRKVPGSVNAETEAEDIVKYGILPLANKKAFDRSSVKFCAVDLDKIPKYNPEETNVHSMMTSISELQGKLSAMEKIVNQNSSRIEELGQTKRVTSGSSNLSLVNPSPLSSASWKDVTFPALRVQGSSDFSSAAKSTPYMPQHPEMIVSPKRSERSQQPSPERPTNGKQSNGQPKSTNEWQQARWQRKKAIQEKAKSVNTIVGKRNTTSLTGAVTTKTIYVANVDRNWTDTDITDEMKSHNVDPVFVKCVSHSEAHTKSFKIVIKEDDQETVMCAEFWPERVKCREWIQVTSNTS